MHERRREPRRNDRDARAWTEVTVLAAEPAPKMRYVPAVKVATSPRTDGDIDISYTCGTVRLTEDGLVPRNEKGEPLMEAFLPRMHLLDRQIASYLDLIKEAVHIARSTLLRARQRVANTR